jgi:signal transduction histidine kinase
VSHDLRTPLAGISAQAEVLAFHLGAGQSRENDLLAAGLQRIHEQAMKMAEALNELVDVASLEAGQPLALRCEPFDLVALAEEAAGEAQRTDSHHTVRVVPHVDELMGVGDRSRLERVIQNLLSNAIKFSPDGGLVTVHLDRDQNDTPPGEWAIISVTDTGLGIPAEDLPHIFDRFHRGRNVPSYLGGTGLGLAGAKQIVELHGGRISVDSREGEGTTVVVRLPIHPQADARIDSSAKQ